MPSFAERFDKLYIPEPNSGCWIWLGALGDGGYGYVFFNGKNSRAHRVSYQIAVGEIPDGLQLDHLCRMRCCVNPTHLEPVTNRENSFRALKLRVRKTHCVHGHFIDGIKIRRVHRQCTECRRIACLRYYHARKSA
jgi:HNH endonuclease